MNAPHMLYLDKEGAGSIVADPENGRLVVSNEAVRIPRHPQSRAADRLCAHQPRRNARPGQEVDCAGR